MDATSNGGQPAVGLRERKKIRTKAAIRQHALRLFSEQGYDNTTMEQIAEAADVSVSTVFRYFTTKDELVVLNDFDLMFVEAFRAQPDELGPVQALRGALHDLVGRLTVGQTECGQNRERLIMAVPQLWAGSLQNITRSMEVLSGLIAERAGREPDDPAVLTLTGAALGVVLEVVLRWAAEPSLKPLVELDSALERLADGLPL